MGFGVKETTAYLPFYGAVNWAGPQLDQQAQQWLTEHQPMGSPWRLPVFRPQDTRVCSGCRQSAVLWEQCPYALWGRVWQATRRTVGFTATV